MFKEVSGNRFFILALVFFILCVGGNRLYQWYILQETKNSFAHLVGAEVLEAREPEKPRVRKPVVVPVIAPVLDASQEERPSSEVAPVTPVTRTMNYTRNSDIKWKDASEQARVARRYFSTRRSRFCSHVISRISTSRESLSVSFARRSVPWWQLSTIYKARNLPK